MAQSLLRKTLKVFGFTGTTDDFEQFGSTAVAATNYTKNIATIQSLAAWVDGWRTALIASKAPVLQDMNAVMYVHSYLEAYLFQEGIAEWDAGTTYNTGSIVKKPYTGTAQGAQLYCSLVDANLNNALPSQVDDANWQFLCDLATVRNPAKYRKPDLVYNSGTLVDIQAGLVDGNAGVAMLFPDNQLRYDSTTAHIQLDITRVAALTGSVQSGILTGTVVSNDKYAIYAVKSQANATDFVLVAALTEPIPANFSTLDSDFGTNGWVYIGTLPYGNGASLSTGFLKFIQNGNRMRFNNFNASGNSSFKGNGILLATTAGATSLTYTYSEGMTNAKIPAYIKLVTFQGNFSSGSNPSGLGGPQTDSGTYYDVSATNGSNTNLVAGKDVPSVDGFVITPSASSAMDLFLAGWIDDAI